MRLFLDTCGLLNNLDIFEKEEKFYISSVTLRELESIKTSQKKDETVKYNARKALELLIENEDRYEMVQFKNSYLDTLIKEYDLEPIDDNRIISCAKYGLNDEIIFFTDDLSCCQTAKTVGLKTLMSKQEEDYTGFKEIELSETELADFYSNLDNPKNTYNLLDNQYLIIKFNNEPIGKYKWRIDHYEEVLYRTIDSTMFGRLSPKDSYQQCVIDSLYNNQLTVIRGQAGSGKSLIGLSYLFQEWERGRIDKIVMFVNPVATKDACKFGFLPGTATEKILGSQIGHFLASKIGDMSMVEKLVYDGELVLIPVSDCRGIDFTNKNVGIYFTEAQNATVDMVKLMLQRIDDESICVFEGDDLSQVDMRSYAGMNNGLRRASKVFRGESYYGEITLQKCYRSKIAAKAEEL